MLFLISLHFLRECQELFEPVLSLQRESEAELDMDDHQTLMTRRAWWYREVRDAVGFLSSRRYYFFGTRPPVPLDSAVPGSSLILSPISRSACG